ncbi:glycerol-3-phosphate ABC transporter ATP-binding protein, partial [Rhizobium ruizarguesonis]
GSPGMNFLEARYDAGGVKLKILHGLPFKIFTLNRDALKAGPKVNVSFPAQYLHVFDAEGKRVD